MELAENDFDNLMFPCYSIKEGMDIFEIFPALKLYSEFKAPLGTISKVKVFRFICFLYDQKSPIRAIDDFIKRSIEASILAKFPTDDGGKKFTEEYMEILKNENDKVLKMIIRFCRIQGSMTFSQLVVMEEIYYRELEQLKTLTEANKRKITIANISNLRVEIEGLKRTLLGENNNRALELLLFKEIEGEELGITPEEIANIYFEGGNIKDYSKYAKKNPI